MMRKLRWFFSLMLVLVLSLATLPEATVVAAPPPAYFVDEAKLPFESLPGTTTTRYWGVQARAGYRIEVPQNWNGELVVYAHGYRGTGLELTVDNPPIRQYLISQGFAWAASSYSKNGYDVKQGVKDTHNLTELFNAKVGKPQRAYLMGVSMGGHITGVAIEQYPNTYAGAMPVCGVMGDVKLFDFFLDFNLAAQALAGHQAVFPYPDDYQTTVVPQLKAALAPTSSSYPFALNAQGLKLRAVTIQRSGGTRPLSEVAFQAWGNFLFTLTNGNDGRLGVAPGNVAGNIDTVYQFDSDPNLTADEQWLNNNILRVAPDPQGLQPNGLANVPPILGNFKIPVLTMHTIGDLFVPFSMEQIYARRAAANGNSGLLVQRAIRDVGHCGFTTAELVAGFSDLVNWVENGVKPSGDDIVDPAKVADSRFGCTFTLTKRSYAPAC